MLVKGLINGLKLSVSLEAFNGGCNRAKYYFPLYYYPLKILEAKKMISYSGRGGIIRMSEEVL